MYLHIIRDNLFYILVYLWFILILEGNSSQVNSARSLESKDETNSTTFNLSSFDALFTVQETNTKDIPSNNTKDSIQKDYSSDFKFGFKDSVSCNSLVDTLQRSSSSVMGVNLSPVKNDDGGGSLVRRCSSTAPTSTDNESFDQSNWVCVHYLLRLFTLLFIIYNHSAVLILI